MKPFLARAGGLRSFAAVLGCLGAGALMPGLASQEPEAPQEPEPRIIEVVATRYMFEPSQIEVATGEPVRLLVRSGDGLHGFGIERFRISEEIPRGGDAVIIDFTPDEAGQFPIVCSVYCGSGHDDMKGTLIVHALNEKTP